MNLGNWLQLSQFERYCWIWDFKNRFISQMEETNIPYLRIRFEDFFGGSDPLDHLNQMLSFLNVTPASGIADQFQRPVNPARGKSFPKWQEWSVAQCQQLHEYCGITMNAYGYGGEKEWMKKIRPSKAESL
jgi:hypothetical protein